MKITLVLPPLTQLNAPYPSTAYLARFLRSQGHEVCLRDLGLELALRLFSRAGLAELFDHLEHLDDLPDPAWGFLAQRHQHEAVVDAVVRFLQGKDRTLSYRILHTPFLPRGPRLSAASLDSFGPAAVDDTARHLATLYLEDLADLVTATVDEGFGLARYQHHLGVSPAPLDALLARLDQTGLIDGFLDTLGESLDGDIICLSVPFPGTFYGALRLGRQQRRQGRYVVLGGGYVNTELRGLLSRDEPRLWDFVDAVCFDDGEGPLAALLRWRQGLGDSRHRTVTREGPHHQPHTDTPAEYAGWYANLRLGDYLSLVDGQNPAHRLWSDGRWNRITLAHGCYWKKCSFCDINLDYIAGYRPNRTHLLVDTMAELMAETGHSGFHLADEAAPPRQMRELGMALRARKLPVSWWGNIRFDPYFTPDRCKLLAASGLVAVTGGLEVASDRLLDRMQKGVSVRQVARVARGFREAGVLVHAYLMYGFPSQTDQETVDAMEVVRQLFQNKVLSSGFWHRFVLTRHSGMYAEPERFQLRVVEDRQAFASNDLEHVDLVGGNHDYFDEILPRALHAWMRGAELDRPVHTWGRRLPQTTLKPNLIANYLAEPAESEEGARLVWLGGDPLMSDNKLVLHGLGQRVALKGADHLLSWVGELVQAAASPEGVGVEVLEGAPAGVEKMLGLARKAGLVRV